jgi:hypothetical protein
VAETIYALCGLTSLACAVLLMRGHRQNRASLLAWSSGCFGLLAVNNALLFVDLVLVPSVDLSLLRHGTALAAVVFLLVGFIWETQ